MEFINQHELILILLIVIVGGLAGYINVLKDSVLKESKSHDFTRYILSAIGSAILVPLFLNMLSSNLIKYNSGYDNNNYFVFAGFCFIAGYFSDRFINTIGDRVLKELKQTNENVADTKSKLERTSQELKDNKEKVDALIDNESELEDFEINKSLNMTDLHLQTELVDDEMEEKVHKIIQAFKGNDDFKFRTIQGLSRKLKYPSNIVEAILNELERLGAVKKFLSSKGSELWTLTKIGLVMAHSNNNSNAIQ